LDNFMPVVQRLNDGKPLLQKVDTHPWENRVTFNPACILVNDRKEIARIVPLLPFSQATQRLLLSQQALCFLLYRAQGKKTESYDHTRSSIGLAVLSAELELLARHTEPVILPDNDYENLGSEDARITKVDDRYFMVYTGYSSGEPKNRVRICLASTSDFVHWEKYHILRADFNNVDNKNGMLFPGRINNKYIMFHRPMEGENAMCLHWAESDYILGPWKTKGLVMKPIPNPRFVDTWIGGAAPPLLLEDGRYLIIYHVGNKKADNSREYDLGIALGDPRRPGFIMKRNEPLLRPETTSETIGDAELGVNNVVFNCGAYFYKGDLYLPYAGADSVVLGGEISGEDLKRYISS